MFSWILSKDPLLLIPLHPARSPRNQDQATKNDAVPCEADKVVVADKAQQPTDADECTDEWKNETNRKQGQILTIEQMTHIHELFGRCAK